MQAAAAAPLPWWYLAGSAAGLWVIGASLDFDNPPVLMGGGLIVALLTVDIAVTMAAYLAHAPRPHTIAGAAMAVTFAVLAVSVQRLIRTRLQADR